MKQKKKKRVVVYIDAENISAKKVDEITAISQREGKMISTKVYRRKDDKYTKNWCNVRMKSELMKEIQLSGYPEKDKIDKRIIKDMKKDLMKNDSIDVVILVSSDHGYAETVKKITKTGKEVIVAGKNISSRLKTAAGEYCEID